MVENVIFCAFPSLVINGKHISIYLGSVGVMPRRMQQNGTVFIATLIPIAE